MMLSVFLYVILSILVAKAAASAYGDGDSESRQQQQQQQRELTHLDVSGDVVMSAIRTIAAQLNSTSTQLHFRTWPITDPIIEFSKSDVRNDRLPYGFPSTITSLDSYLREWLHDHDQLKCVGAGGLTAPLSYIVFKNETMPNMINVRISVNSTAARSVDIVEKSLNSDQVRVMARYPELYVSHMVDGEQVGRFKSSDETLVYCLQTYFPVKIKEEEEEDDK